MGFALLTLSSFSQPLNALARWLRAPACRPVRPERAGASGRAAGVSAIKSPAPASQASIRTHGASLQPDSSHGPETAARGALPQPQPAEAKQLSLLDGALDGRAQPAPPVLPRRFAVVRPRLDRPELAHPAPVGTWSSTSANDSAAFTACSRPRNAASMRPLRVLDRRGPGAAARVLISGRMADVCAELDRLVRAEAAMQTPH